MKLNTFIKNAHKKKLAIGLTTGFILLIGIISLYRTFALYEEKKEFNILQGRVPDFRNITILASIEGEITLNIPTKGSEYKPISVSCDKGTIAHWDENNWKIQIDKLSDKDVTCIIFFSRYFSNYLINLSNKETAIEKFTHEETYQTPALTDYRYVGKNPNNYVCLSEEQNCPEDNLYRIIGVIPTQSTEDGEYKNRVKLIKSDVYSEQKSGLFKEAGYQWNASNTRNWASSTLNTTVLNEVYWNSLGIYQYYIEEAKWYLGAPTYGSYSAYTPDTFYSRERSQYFPKGITNNHIAKVGLMYPSDYGYSIGSSYKSKSIVSNKSFYVSNAWLFTVSEWTISPEYNNSTVNAWRTMPDGRITYGTVTTYNSNIRPCFYLKEETYYKNGNGSRNNPYKVTLQ